MPPFITIWIYVGNRVVVAISVKVETVYRFGIKIFYAIGRNKSTDFRVVITRFEIVQFGFGVVIISAQNKQKKCLLARAFLRSFNGCIRVAYT